MELSDQAKSYILRFLTGYEDEAVFRRFRIGYTNNPELFSHYDLVFIPSGFFTSPDYGTERSLPKGQLPQIEGVPFLYGSERVEKSGNTVLVYADLPATVFFFLSRYEEICRRHVRDIHGRFPGRESVLYKNHLIFRPILDEYTVLVRQWLREAGINLPEPTPGISTLWLTHDIDAPYYCKGLRSFFRETFKQKKPVHALKFLFQKKENDPYFTFNRFLETDVRCRQKADFPVQISYFLKSRGRTPMAKEDRPFYRLNGKPIKNLIKQIQANKGQIGLHGSYASGAKRADNYEKRRLEQALGRKVYFFRNHYLRSTEPEHFSGLENMGITDDFTMGYADVAGFRLGTSRSCCWIDAKTGRLSKLVLHPLLIMDNTLSDPDYMDMDYETAQKYCTSLFNTVKQYGGEICLLWHNTSMNRAEYPVNPAPWLAPLYSYLLDYLAEIQ